MGPELALALMAGGTGAQMLAQQDAADERRSMLNQQLARDKAATGRAIDLVQQEGQRFTPQARLQGLQGQADTAYNQAQTDLGGAGANLDTAGDAGNVSSDFLKTKAARAIDEGTRLTSVAREVAKARAPGMLGAEDSLSRANLAGNLQDLWGTNRRMAGATQLDASSVTEPAYGAFGKVASALGTAGLMGAINSPYAGSSTNPSAPNYENALDRLNPSSKLSGILFRN